MKLNMFACVQVEFLTDANRKLQNELEQRDQRITELQRARQELHDKLVQMDSNRSKQEEARLQKGLSQLQVMCLANNLDRYTKAQDCRPHFLQLKHMFGALSVRRSFASVASSYMHVFTMQQCNRQLATVKCGSATSDISVHCAGIYPCGH